MSQGVFWLLVGLLSVIALACVVWPLRRLRIDASESNSASPTREATVRALYRERLQELERERELQILSAEDYAAAVAELGGGLIADTEQQAAPSIPANTVMGEGPWGSSRILLVSTLTLLLSGAVYWQIGQPDAAAMAEVAALVREPDIKPEQLLRFQTTLERHLARKPGDARSWYLLGHVHLRSSRYQAASAAFTQAHDKQGGVDPNIALYLLQSRYLAAGGKLDDESKELVSQVLESSPNHPLILEILAMDAFRSKDYNTAVQVLNRALSNPLSPGQRASLQVGLNQARAQLGAASPGIDVAIDGLAQAPARATLFVIARPIGGGMPYAVVRRPGPDYPRKVRLDDAVSMSPANPLSAAKDFEVVVRLSMSGAAQAHAGDWQWRSQPLSLGGATQPATLDVTLQPQDHALGNQDG